MTGALELSGAPVIMSSYMDRMLSVSSFFFIPKPSAIAVRIGFRAFILGKY